MASLVNNCAPFIENPNILILMSDQERYSPVSDIQAVKDFLYNLPGKTSIRSNSVSYTNHYIASAACVPSRASMFTGHYSKMTGVSQTNGVAKAINDPGMFWLKQGTVPTIGNYFKQAKRRSRWVGKWHMSFEDLVNPGTNSDYYSTISYDKYTGLPDKQLEDFYLSQNVLKPFGYDGWVGPEPFGPYPWNFGSVSRDEAEGRDPIYAQYAIETLKKFEKNGENFHLTVSFVDPHDIVAFGDLGVKLPRLNFTVDPSVPDVPLPPTYNEDLSTKPTCQMSYKEAQAYLFQPISDLATYLKVYYTLIKAYDSRVNEIMTYLKQSSLHENTIVIVTSDHGEFLASHGGLHEKWYAAYDEALKVPFSIYNPILFNGYKTCDDLTSHIDLLPTVLGLANIDIVKMQRKLSKKFSTAVMPVGRKIRIPFDNATAINYSYDVDRVNEPVFFYITDDPSRGNTKINAALSAVKGSPVLYPQVAEPIGIEGIVTIYNGKKYKYCVYFDPTGTVSTLEYEMYNLTDDPTEVTNLCYPANSTPESEAIKVILQEELDSQKAKKLLSPIIYNNIPPIGVQSSTTTTATA